MTHLNTLAFVTVPKHSSLSPVIGRHNRLIDRLEEQKRLAPDPNFIPLSKRWKKTPDGSKALVDHYRRIRPWWRKDEAGNLILTITRSSALRSASAFARYCRQNILSFLAAKVVGNTTEFLPICPSVRA
jgi:hypothetical protein